MKCRNAKASLTAHLLGELDREQSARIEEHLESCPECRAYAEKQKATLVLLRESLAATSDLPERLDQEHRSAVFATGEGDEEQFMPWTVRYGIPLRLAALLLVTVGLFIAILPVVIPSLQMSAPRGMSSSYEAGEADMLFCEMQPVSDAAGLLGQAFDDGIMADSPVEPAVEYPNWDKDGADSSSHVGFGGSVQSAGAANEVRSRSSQTETIEDISTITPADIGDFNFADRLNAPKAKAAPKRAVPEPAQEMEMEEIEDVNGSVVMKGLFAGRSAGMREDKLVSKDAAESERRKEEVGLDLALGSEVASGAVGGKVYYRHMPEEIKRDVGGLDYDASREARVPHEKPQARRAGQEAESGVVDEEAEEEIVARPHGFNPFVRTEENAFSTFGIDCDTASYTMARNLLREGRRPPPASVRSEEFVNFFDYRYSAPRRRLFSIYTECAPSPFGRGLHLLDIGIKDRRLGRDQQRPARLTLAIDCSGSMNTEDRIGLLRLALERLLDHLSPQDEVAIVSYGSQARLMLEHTPVEQKKRILDAVKSLRISGSTHLEAGLLLAYSQAARAFRSGAVNRVILLSDGRANLGSDSAEQILAQIDEYRKQGIFCSVFGFGTGNYNDDLLETLANKGDGTYAFIDSEQEVDRVFVEDLAATLHVIAKDAKIQVEFDPRRVLRYRQIGYENRRLRKEDFRNDSVDAGEVGSGQSVTALYELELTGDSDIPLGIVRVRAFDMQEERIVEIDAPIGPPSGKGFEQASERIKLAAVAAELAEILRGSPHARGSTIDDVLNLARPLAQELHLDQKVQELLRILNSARGMY